MRRSFRPHLETLDDRIVPATLPAGFSEAAIVSGLSSPTAMEVTSDGTLFITEQGGTMEVWRNGTRIQANFFANSPLTPYNPAADQGRVDSRGERGLLGVTLDPNFATNRFVYVYYTRAVNPDGNTGTSTVFRNRVSRFTADAAGTRAIAGSETLIVELDALSGATNHNGGAIHFGPDGRLYIAVGDNANSANAPSLATRHGKMLRLNANGTIPSDNPFFTTATGVNRAIWAIGLRNPFTFTFQPGTGRMHINDVGQNTWEEINIGAPGANYGWPTTEGDFNPASFPNFTRPLYAYSHGGGTFQGFAITGGAFYNPTSPGNMPFPSTYTGTYFFADFVNGWINRIDPSTRAVTRFAGNVPSAVDLDVTPDGSLLYLGRDDGRVMRVVYSASAAPTIVTPPSSLTVARGAPATFRVEARGSGTLVYRWQRADAGSDTFVDINGATSSTYTIPAAQSTEDGARFRVIVSNALGMATSESATLTVTANDPPTISILFDQARFIAGEAVGFQASAADAQDGAVTNLVYRVEYITSIASGQPAVRPFVPTTTGSSGIFTPATTGPYTLTDVAYRVVVTATDSVGASTTTFLDIEPTIVQLTVTTSPGGLEVTVDGQPFTAPYSFDSVVGFRRTLGAGPLQLADTTYDFSGWSDGGAATHAVATPDTNATYTARYTPTAHFRLRVQFRPSSAAGQAGYLPDFGDVFHAAGGGISYGWRVSNRAAARVRGLVASPLYNSLQVMAPSAVWEIAVPNGEYTVRVVSGDAHPHLVAARAYYQVLAEGRNVVAGMALPGRAWVDGTVTVRVLDGRLTLTSGPRAMLNRINFVEIVKISTVTSGTDGTLRVEAEMPHFNTGAAGSSWLIQGPLVRLATQAGPRLDYRMEFARAGTYFVWVRGAAGSVGVGIDGQMQTSVTLGPTLSWNRRNGIGGLARITVTTPGVHLLSVWGRTNNTRLDRLLLTQSATFAPA